MYQVPPGKYETAPADLVRRARALAQACADAGATLRAAALQFPLRHPAVAYVVAGMPSPYEVQLAATRLREHIPVTLWPEFDRVVLRA